MEYRAVSEDAFQSIGLDGRSIRERSPDTEELAGNRQDGDRQHETAADSLQDGKDLVFHKIPPFTIGINKYETVRSYFNIP